VYSPVILWWSARFERGGKVIESAHTNLRPAMLWVECRGFNAVTQANIQIDM
jgi:hypothetical protein